jgi:hypothetical protein
MLIREAFAIWQSEIRPAVVETYGEDDGPSLSESWNDYTDSLCKDGELTALQYHYCPAYDDDMPGGQYGDDADERDYMLDQLGVRITYTAKPLPPEDVADFWNEEARHFTVTLHRGESSMSVPFSMGPKAGDNPTREDVLYCLIRDRQGLEDAGDTFEDYAREYELDEDSRRAERMYERTKAQSAALEELFKDVDMDDLAALFEDF